MTPPKPQVVLECRLVHRLIFFTAMKCDSLWKDKPMEKAKINFDWPLDLLRSETVKVYVNNEINILVFFWAKWGSILIQMCFGLKNSFVNLGMSFFILFIQLLLFYLFFPVTPKTFWN